MATEQTRLAEGLLKALQAERDGHSFYNMAATSSQDPKAREIFAQLAAEELDHMGFLARHYESVLKTGRPDSSANLGSRAALSGAWPIFSEAIKTRLKDAHFEMSALSIGIQLELDAQKSYRELAGRTDEPVVKKFLLELADWEAGHYQALLQQQESLKEDYWTENGFAAF
ncbi:MAG: ferritin family protein [Planctomycetota bacterium]